MKSQITHAIIFLAAVYYAVGYLLVFFISRETARDKMEQVIANHKFNQVTSFTFSRESWVKLQINKNEFVLDRNIYDIVSIKEMGDYFAVNAICDHREKELAVALGTSTTNDTNTNETPSFISIVFQILADKISTQEYRITSLKEQDSFLLSRFCSSHVSRIYHHEVFSPPDFMNS